VVTPVPPPAAPLKLCAAPKAQVTKAEGKPGYTELEVSVTDAGAPVKGLKPDDFVVYAGSHRYPIDSFSNLSGTPASLVVAIDSSGSMQAKLETLQKELGAFFKGLNACDEVAIISFGSAEDRDPDSPSIKLVQPFTTDHALAASRLESLKPYGQTALFDAVDQGLRLLGKAHYPNRAMVLITDGMDNISVTGGDAAVAKARRNGWPVYAIGIGDPHADLNAVQIGPFVVNGGGADRVDPVFLKDLAAASGGRAFIVPEFSRDDGGGFKTAITAIVAALGSQYLIGVIAPSGSAWTETDLPVVAVPSRSGSVLGVKLIDVRPDLPDRG
jgi:Ca-activated chloride channel family protein